MIAPLLAAALSTSSFSCGPVTSPGYVAAKRSHDPLELVHEVGDPVRYAQAALDAETSVRDRMRRMFHLYACGQYELAVEVGLPTFLDHPGLNSGLNQWHAANLADALIALGRLDEAAALLDHVLMRDGDEQETLMALGRVRRAQGDEEGCLSAWQVAIEAGGRLQATTTLARARIDRGEPLEALRWLEQHEFGGRGQRGCFASPPWSQKDELMIECWFALGELEQVERTSRRFAFEIEGKFARTVPFLFACAWIESQVELGRDWPGIEVAAHALTYGQERDLSNLWLAFDVVRATHSGQAAVLFDALVRSDWSSFPVLMKRLMQTEGAREVARRELGGANELFACAVLVSLQCEEVALTLDARIRKALATTPNPSKVAAELYLLAKIESAEARRLLESFGTATGRGDFDLAIGYVCRQADRYAGPVSGSYVLGASGR